MKAKKQIKNIKAELVQDVEQALYTCISLFKSDVFLLLQAQYLSTKKYFDLGILSFQEFLQIQNRVVNGVLETLKDCERDIKKLLVKKINLFLVKIKIFY